jgi:pimeloyl-ACP methyl ester carboxylesterase
MNKPASAKSTYLLVHGAWHNSQCWGRVVPLLTSAGHRVLAPSLTGHGCTAHLLNREVGLDTHVDDIVKLIVGERLTEVILVGHGYAGLVISAAANQVPDRVAHLVFVDAMVPQDGQSGADLCPEPARQLIESTAQSSTDWRVPPLPESPPPVGLFGVVDLADAAWLRTLLSDESVLCFRQSVRMDDPAVNAIPRTHIHCVGAMPEGTVREPVPAIRPDGSPAQVWELATGHDCMITMPVELTELLLKIRQVAPATQDR